MPSRSQASSSSGVGGVADLGDIELLVANAHRDAWRETVIMAAGHANEPLRRDLIAGLLTRIRAEPKHARRLELLVVACLETLPSLPRDLSTDIDRCLDDLIPPRNVGSARSLAIAGEPVLARLPDSLNGLSTAAARAVVRTAWLINGPEALDALSRYSADKRVKVQKELNDAWDYFDPDEYAQRVLAKTLDIGWRLQVRTAGQLAALRWFPPISRLDVSEAKISDLDFLAKHAERLTDLNMLSLAPNADLSALTFLPNLQSIQLGMRGLADMSFLNDVPLLRGIWLYSCDHIVDYTPLVRHTSLRSLGLGGSHRLTGIEMLPPLDNVVSLNLSGSRLECGLENIVVAAPRTAYLQVEGCRWVNDLSSLGSLPLVILTVRNCSSVDDFSSLAQLTKLEYLGLSRTHVSDLAPLAGLTKLETLWLDGCHDVSDLSPLASLTNLRSLNLKDVAPGIDLTPLAGNRRLNVHIGPGQDMRGAEALGRRLRTGVT